jgi:aminopeptidase N
MARAVALATLWDMVMTGALPASAFSRCVNVALVRETVEPLVEPLLSHATAAAERWAPLEESDSLLSELADTCIQILDHGGARKLVALRTLARCATSEAQLETLQSHVGNDFDLQWRTLTRLAALGRIDQAAIAELTERDPDPDAWVRAMAVKAAQPESDAKQATWDAVMVKHSVPIGSLRIVARAFWQTAQADVLAPFADRYLKALPELSRLGMIPAMSASAAMFPYVGTGAAFADQVEAVARSSDVSPVVTGRVLESADQLRRMVAARGQ